MRRALLVLGALLALLCVTACASVAPPSIITKPDVTQPQLQGGHTRFSLNGTGVGFTNTTAPTIGQTLNASTGVWGNNPLLFRYQWQRCDVLGNNCTNVSGATNPTYTITTADNNVSVRVVVTASNAGGSTPSASLASAPAIVGHVPNWAYDDGCNGGAGTSTALVHTWVTDAENNCGFWTIGGAHPSKALTDCVVSGVTFCNVLPYVDTNKVFTATPPGTLFSDALESWYLHESAPNQATRLTTTAFGGGFVMNQNTPAYQAFWRNFINTSYPGATGLFMDDQTPIYPFFGDSDTASTEITSIGQEQGAHTAMSNALINNATGQPYPQSDNTIPNCGNQNESAQGIGPAANMLTGPVTNLVAESCPSTNGTLIAFYAGLLDDMAWINTNTSGSITLLSFGATGAGYQTQERLMQAATVLMGYSPGHTINWSELEQGSAALSIFPESGLVPTNPIQTMVSPSGTGCLTLNTNTTCSAGGHNNLLTGTSGVYRREFQHCYNQGTLIGQCAVVVNTTAAAVTVSSAMLTQSYGHSVTLTGGDVQAGGTINTAGATFTVGTTQAAADSALILTP